MQSLLFDTSVYIRAIRQKDLSILAKRGRAANEPLWLSAVVLEELYAGADAKGRRLLERLEKNFDKVNRILVPNLNDWTTTGEVLSKIGDKYGYEQIGRARLTNDALIAMSAARTGLIVETVNARDFARIAEFRPFKWKLV